MCAGMHMYRHAYVRAGVCLFVHVCWSMSAFVPDVHVYRCASGGKVTQWDRPVPLEKGDV